MIKKQQPSNLVQSVVSKIQSELLNGKVHIVRPCDSNQFDQPNIMSPDLKTPGQFSLHEHKHFVRKMKLQHKQLLDRRTQSIIKNFKMQKSLQEKQIQKHRSASRSLIEMIKASHRNRKSKPQLSQEGHFKAAERVPLYKMMEQNFNKQSKRKEQDRAKVLQKLKQNRRSISLNQIKQHKRRIDQIVKESRKSQSQQDTCEYPFRSARYQQIKRYQAELNQALRKKAQFLSAKVVRHKELWQSIKQNYLPQVDPQKQKILQSKISSLKTKVIQSKDHNQLGKKYLMQSKLLISRTSKVQKSNIMTTNFPQKRPDYLLELRKNKQQIKSVQQESRIKLILEQQPPGEKRKERLRKQIERLQRKMISKQSVGRLNSTMQVQNNYFDLIKAKIDILS